MTSNLDLDGWQIALREMANGSGDCVAFGSKSYQFRLAQIGKSRDLKSRRYYARLFLVILRTGTEAD